MRVVLQAAERFLASPCLTAVPGPLREVVGHGHGEDHRVLVLVDSASAMWAMASPARRSKPGKRSLMPPYQVRGKLWRGRPPCVPTSRTGGSRWSGTKDSATLSKPTVQMVILTSNFKPTVVYLCVKPLKSGGRWIFETKIRTPSCNVVFQFSPFHGHFKFKSSFWP